MLKKLSIIFGWVFVFQLIGYGLGLITRSSITTWYAALEKSTLTPPNMTFPIVWSMLYVMLALSGWSLWQHRKEPQAILALSLFGTQMVLNWIWSPLFFYFHQIGLSFYCIILITCFTLITLLITKNNFKFSCVMLIPYFIWLIFAGYLNWVIWVLN